MSVFAISDLHLSTNTDKSMEAFGDRWTDYTRRISENWRRMVGEGDTVILGGDISWEMRLEGCVSDFEYINSLPGRKIISKGNHDYWWETAAKHKAFLESNGFENIEFLYNNAYSADGIAICGTRWWNDPTSDGFGTEDLKIYRHEILRLEASLERARSLNCEKTVAVLHYPPFDALGRVNVDVGGLFERYGVDVCLYGHLQGVGIKTAVEGKFGATNYHLTSADYLDFCPIRINF